MKCPQCQYYQAYKQYDTIERLNIVHCPVCQFTIPLKFYRIKCKQQEEQREAISKISESQVA